MTDLNEVSIFDPKAEILKELLEATFWEYLKDGAAWKLEIEGALEASSKEQLEIDNFELQEENQLRNRVISEQEIEIKRLKELISKYRESMGKVFDTVYTLDQYRVREYY